MTEMMDAPAWRSREFVAGKGFWFLAVKLFRWRFSDVETNGSPLGRGWLIASVMCRCDKLKSDRVGGLEGGVQR